MNRRETIDFLGSRSHDNNVSYPLNNAINAINDYRFDPNLETIFFIHGYQGQWWSEHVYTIANAYNERGIYNTLVLDWSSVVNYDFPEYMDRLPAVKNVIS